jgi:hypothetical protein
MLAVRVHMGVGVDHVAVLMTVRVDEVGAQQQFACMVSLRVESGLGKDAGAIARARFEGVGTFWPTVTFGWRVE